MKICFITGTRAEYGILAPIMREIASCPDLASLQIIATNMHLSPEYGLTVREIEKDGFSPDAKIEMLLSSDTPTGTVKSMGVEAMGLADALERLRPDRIVILGDRYEMLTAASAAIIFGIPIVHLHGGETTLGAYDNSIRHAITQLSDLHLTATEEYRHKVISMGKDASMVHCIGSPAADAISTFKPMALPTLEKELNFNLGENYLVVTFHPVTLQSGDEQRQINALLEALQSLPDNIKFLFTLPNSDTGSRIVRENIENWVATYPTRAKSVSSLGAHRYFSAVKHSKGVVGNSSSGIIEAPSLKVPTLDIGDRQKGRIRASSVLHVEPIAADIINGLQTILLPQNQTLATTVRNPYYYPNTVKKAARLIMSPF